MIYRSACSLQVRVCDATFGLITSKQSTVNLALELHYCNTHLVVVYTVLVQGLNAKDFHGSSFPTLKSFLARFQPIGMIPALGIIPRHHIESTCETWWRFGAGSARFSLVLLI
jgi:hypothetical protein